MKVKDHIFEPGQELIISRAYSRSRRRRIIVHKVISRTEKGSVLVDVSRKLIDGSEYAINGHGWRQLHYAWEVEEVTKEFGTVVEV